MIMKQEVKISKQEVKNIDKQFIFLIVTALVQSHFLDNKRQYTFLDITRKPWYICKIYIADREKKWPDNFTECYSYYDTGIWAG